MTKNSRQFTLLSNSTLQSQTSQRLALPRGTSSSECLLKQVQWTKKPVDTIDLTGARFFKFEDPLAL
jgi:hypothetical protein